MPDSTETAERDELEWLSKQLSLIRPILSTPLNGVIEALDDILVESLSPLAREQALEDCARSVRSIWLKGVAAETSMVLRSPTDEEAHRVARDHDSYGYERDFRPDELERKLAANENVADGWRAEVVLFSSAQAAMTSLLLALQAKGAKKISLLGHYFETHQLIERHRSLGASDLIDEFAAEIIIAEPVSCDGAFSNVNLSELAQRLSLIGSRATIIADTTLSGLINMAPMLALSNGAARVFRLVSGLKLLQAGLELANVGLVSMFTTDAKDAFAEELRRTRTLTGSGLRFADALALEAPWFADSGYSQRYTQAVFTHNARLAHEVAHMNRRFRAVEHPSFTGANAPFCVFRLQDGQEDALHQLAADIERLSRARNILFERGGSFGFRGHRYDVIVPETGDGPFLRIAMGRRGGRNMENVVSLIAQLSRQA